MAFRFAKFTSFKSFKFNTVKIFLRTLSAVIPCEHFFSSVTVRKNKTDFRASMNSGTLSNILTHKTSMSAKSQVCHSVQHSEGLLKKAKSYTYVAMQAGQKP